jgi:hypothetical protein
MITRNGSIITLENEFIRRVIECKDGLQSNTYHLRPGGNQAGSDWYPVFSFETGIPFEAALLIDDKIYEARQYKINTSGDLWAREGAFKVKDIITGRGNHGDTLDIVLTRRFEEMPDIELHIEYEVSDNMPFISKRLKIINIGNSDVTIQNASVDIVRFFARKLPLYVFSDYYWDIKKEDPYYIAWTRMEFPDNIDYKLSAGESFTTFTVYEACTSMDRQEESIKLHRIYKDIAPWIKTLNPTLTVDSCKSLDDFKKSAEAAGKNHFQLVCLHVGQVFENTGDYIPRGDIFPNGYEDVKKMIGYYHENGIKVLPYSSTTIAWRSSEVCIKHPDWQYLGPEGMRYSPEGFGNMCYQSPWGDYIKEKLFYLVDEIGFDGLALDGPYHSLPCLDSTHKHANPGTVKFMNWAWEKDFFGQLVDRQKLIFVPQTWNSLLLGVNETPAGYREEDQNEMGGMSLVTMTRACVYESRYDTPACGHWTSFNMRDYHGHSMEASEENTASYEHALAGVFGYGFDGSIYASEPYVGKKTKAIYDKWLGIFDKYKETFLGEFVHLAQPNGYQPDGVMHVNPKAEVPALAVLFNPCKEQKKLFLSLPLGYAGFKENDTAVANGEELEVDSCGNACIKVALKPEEVKVIPINKAK